MDPQSQKMLEELHVMVGENNKMLKDIRRHQKISSALRLFYWVIIIGISVGAFYFIQPYVDQVMNIYSGASETIKDLTR